jgi:hypothetical protein
MKNRLEPHANALARESLPSKISAEGELHHLKNVLGNIMQDTLKTWDELWGEFDERVVSGSLVLPQAEQGFKPACGWPEFLEKMWQLRFYIASAKKFCDQRS